MDLAMKRIERLKARCSNCRVVDTAVIAFVLTAVIYIK
jgi:hypothetical protein